MDWRGGGERAGKEPRAGLSLLGGRRRNRERDYPYWAAGSVWGRPSQLGWISARYGWGATGLAGTNRVGVDIDRLEARINRLEAGINRSEARINRLGLESTD